MNYGKKNMTSSSTVEDRKNQFLSIGKVANKGSNSEIVDLLKEGDKRDQQLVALRIFFESGTADEKKMARDALFAYAFPSNQDTTAGSTNKVDLTNNNVNSDDETSEEEDNDSILS